MTTYIITWAPSRWEWKPEEYEQQVSATEKGEVFPFDWSCGKTKSIVKGDRVFLFRQESNRGIIGSGFVTRGSFEGEHFDEARAKKGDKALYINYDCEVLVPADKRLPLEDLLKANLGVHWERLMGSGWKVPAESEEKLAKLWKRHLLAIGWRKRTSPTKPPNREPLLEALEGNAYRGEATFRYRNRSLIEKKKQMSDGRCSVCNLKFSERYNGIEDLCLVAHHVKPIGPRTREVRTKTTLDEIDLLCPNCHTAVHTKAPPLTASELRKMLVE